MQIDPGVSPTIPYDISFNNMRMKNVLGSFDSDNDSDLADLMLWQRGLTPDPYSNADFMEWEDNFGSVGESLVGGSIQVVPEPAAAGLMLLGALTILTFRKRSLCSN